MKTILELAYNYHKEWIRVVISFGCNPSQAEDVVSEMYIQLHNDLDKNIDFTYKDDVNKYYCYKILRGIFLSLNKKKKKILKIYLEELNHEPIENLPPPIDEVKHAKKQNQVDNVLNELFWYNKKVYKIIASGKTISSLSRETGISYYSLYNTYTKTKKRVKNSFYL